MIRNCYTGFTCDLVARSLKLQSDNIFMIESEWDRVIDHVEDRRPLASVMYDAIMSNTALRVELTDPRHVEHFTKLGFKPTETETIYEYRPR